MRFYDLHVHTKNSTGKDSIEEIVSMTKKMDLTGLGIAKYFSKDMDFNWPEYKDLDIVKTVILKPNNVDELVEMANSCRNKAEVLMVYGGDYDVNRKACELSMVDVLCHPEKGRKDSGLDHICTREASKNNVAIEINFRSVLKTFKRKRVYILESLKKNVFLCDKYNTPIITTSSAISKWDLRNGRQLSSLPHLLGMDLNMAVNSVSKVPENIVSNNRKKLENKKWEGVSVE